MSKLLLKLSLLAVLGSLIQPPPVQASGADDGRTKKFNYDNCEEAIEGMDSGLIPRTVLLISWCMDPQSGMQAGMAGRIAPGSSIGANGYVGS
jgi:hypothetical protein